MMPYDTQAHCHMAATLNDTNTISSPGILRFIKTRTSDVNILYQMRLETDRWDIHLKKSRINNFFTDGTHVEIFFRMSVLVCNL
jgi:hypothetical protein